MIEDAKTILKTYRELRLPDYPVTQVLGRCLHESSIAILHYGLDAETGSLSQLVYSTRFGGCYKQIWRLPASQLGVTRAELTSHH